MMNTLSITEKTQRILIKTYFMNIIKIRSKLYLIIVLIFSCTFTYGQGFIWNEEIEQQYISEVPELEVSRAIFPSSYSLEKYLPRRMYQGGTSMCMAYSLAVGRTILYAKNQKMSDIDEINDIRFSPFFSYILSMEEDDDDCQGGLMPMVTLYHSKKYGMIMQKYVESPDYYPYTKERLSCAGYPGNFESDFLQASKYTIDNFHRLTKVNQIKASISSKNPVIVGMGTVPFSFVVQGFAGEKHWVPYWEYKCEYEFFTKNKCYSSYKDHMTGYCSKHLPSDYELCLCRSGKKYGECCGSSIGHAMILIGYDDKKESFLILNSWGSKKQEWGRNGKIWVKYDDFFNYFDAALSISKKREISVFSSNKTYKGESIPTNLIKEVYSKQAVSYKETIKNIRPDLRKKD